MADLIPGGTRNHPLLFNRDLIGQHPAEAVGVLSPYSMNPNYIGKTWTFIGNLDANPIICIAYLGNGIVIAGAGASGGGGGFLYKSTSYGNSVNTWNILVTSPAWVGNSVNTMEYLGDGIVLIATGDRHVYRSTDYGFNWSDSGLISAFTLNVLRYVGWSIVLLGDASGFVHRSTNYGQTFPFAIGLGSSILSIEYLDDEIVVVGLTNGHIWRTSNFTGLFTWSDRGNVSSSSPINTITYLGDGVAIAGADNAHIYRTTDFGVTWTDVGGGAPVADSKIKTSVYLGNGVVVIGTDAGGRIWRSTDYGLTWADLGAVTPNAFSYDTLTYLGNGVVVAGDSGGNIVRSEIAYKLDEFTQNIEKRIRTITLSGTLVNNNDDTLLVDATAGNMTIYLPSITIAPGHVFNFVRVDATANTVTIDAAGAETINLALTQLLNVQFMALSMKAKYPIFPNGGWWII